VPRGRGKTPDLTGHKFGRLIVLCTVGTRFVRGNRRRCWLCQCACGNRKEIPTGSLLNKTVQSCGCLRRETAKKPKPHCRKHPFESLYHELLKCAKRRKIPCSLTLEEFIKFTTVVECHYCGDPVEWPEFQRRVGDHTTSQSYHLDRKDNTLGYLENNLVVCCGPCNRGKSKYYSYEEWVIMTAALRKYRRKGREDRDVSA